MWFANSYLTFDDKEDFSYLFAGSKNVLSMLKHSCVHVDNDLVYEVAFHIVEKPAEVLDEIMEHQLDEFSLQFRGYHLKELVLFYNYVKV